jgi:sulfonate transport system permease protein
LWRRTLLIARNLVVIAVVIGIWQWLVSSGTISAQFLASPSQIVRAIVDGYTNGQLTTDTAVTLQRVAVGWAVGCGLGYIVGLIIGVAKLADETLGPLLELLRPVSPVALVPVAILWFGIGNFAKYFIIAFACFWPVLLNTKAGVRRIPDLQRRVAKVLHLSWSEQLFKVYLPGTLPDVFVGLRLSAGIAFVVVVAAELVGATDGLGYQILSAEQSFKTPLVFGAVVLLALFGLAANIILETLRRMVVRWNW